MSINERKLWLAKVMYRARVNGYSLDDLAIMAYLTPSYFTDLSKLNAVPSLSEMAAITKALEY